MRSTYEDPNAERPPEMLDHLTDRMEQARKNHQLLEVLEPFVRSNPLFAIESRQNKGYIEIQLNDPESDVKPAYVWRARWLRRSLILQRDHFQVDAIINPNGRHTVLDSAIYTSMVAAAQAITEHAQKAVIEERKLRITSDNYDVDKLRELYKQSPIERNEKLTIKYCFMMMTNWLKSF